LEDIKHNKLKTISILAAFSGLLAVVIGAFGAHSLVDKIPASSLQSFKTGVSYQFYHTIAAFLAIVFYNTYQTKYFKWASVSFLVGVLLFSGSIYLLSTKSIINLLPTKILGPLTPIGGLFFIIGWFKTFQSNAFLTSN